MAEGNERNKKHGAGRPRTTDVALKDSSGKPAGRLVAFGPDRVLWLWSVGNVLVEGAWFPADVYNFYRDYITGLAITCRKSGQVYDIHRNDFEQFRRREWVGGEARYIVAGYRWSKCPAWKKAQLSLLDQPEAEAVRA
mgnify:CR=1 FL=1